MRLFALRATRPLGGLIAQAADTVLDPIEERDFPDGEHKSRPLISVRNEDVYVVQGLNAGSGQSPADRLLRLLMFLATCRDNGAARVTAIVPYMAFMRKEVQTKSRDPVSSKYLADLFEAVGPDMVVTLEAHNKAAFQNAFRSATVHLGMHHLFVAAVSRLVDPGKIVFLSPDSGGIKRTNLLLESFAADGHGKPGLAMMEKHRSEGIVTGELFAGDVEGSTVVIVDDIISTGGTILRAAEAARMHGAKGVIAVATHGLFNGASDALFSSKAVDRIIVSDSTGFDSIDVADARGKLAVVSCAPLFAQTIQRLHGGGSIGRLVGPTP